MVRNGTDKYERRINVLKRANVFRHFHLPVQPGAATPYQGTKIRIIWCMKNYHSILKFFTGFIRAARMVFSPTERIESRSMIPTEVPSVMMLTFS